MHVEHPIRVVGTWSRSQMIGPEFRAQTDGYKDLPTLIQAVRTNSFGLLKHMILYAFLHHRPLVGLSENRTEVASH